MVYNPATIRMATPFGIAGARDLAACCRQGNSFQGIRAVTKALDQFTFHGLTRLSRMAEVGRYRRFLICRNDAYEVLALVWGRGAESPLHGHSGAVCAVKVLCGNIFEEVVCGNGCCLQGAYRHGAGSVFYSLGADFRHKVASPEGVAVTIHLYAGPLGFEVEPLPSSVQLINAA